MEDKPAFLTTWRGEGRERAVRTKREPLGVLATRPFLIEQGEPAQPMRLLSDGRTAFLGFGVTRHESRNTNHGFFRVLRPSGGEKYRQGR